MSRPEVIIALDFATGVEALAFLDKFDAAGIDAYVKVGMELYYSEGPSIIKAIKERGHRIFLDLKLHDIPNTVKRSMCVLAELGVDMTNVHAAGGRKMMEAALEGLCEGAGGAGKRRPLLIAVTQLTSTDQEMMNSELLIGGKLEDVAAQYAKNAARAGLDGVVCSAWEAGLIKDKVREGVTEGTEDTVYDNFVTVTPGIRLRGDAAADQSRVATPARAKELGSDYLVVGRSITSSADPVAAYNRCMLELE